ncbi:MAG: tetratricopeptide repeat protein, partial [Nanoarchaeota archaeon]
LLIALLGFACYFNALTSPFIWDDVGLVSNNYLIKDAKYIGKIFLTDLFNLQSEGCNFYRPMQALSYMLDYQIWGLNPFGYHLTNVILHVLNAILVYLLLMNIMLQATGYRLQAKSLQLGACSLERNYIPFLTALFWVAHPIHVEAVTYIAGRADILLGLFLFLALILFIRGFYLLSLFSFIFALLSKELGLIFPFLLLIYGFGYKLPLSEKRPPGIFVYLTFFLASIGYLYARSKIFLTGENFSLFSLSLPDVLFFITAPFLYLKTLLLPVNLHMSYTVKLPASIFEPRVLFSFFTIILLVLLVVRTYRRFRLFSFALGWFALFLLPHLGIFAINAFFAEHFCYIASIGIFLILAIISAWLMRRKKIFIFLPAALILFYAFLTIRYNFDWQDEERFYKRILKFSQNSFTVYNNLGFIEEKRGNYPQAEKYYLCALDIKPDFEYALINLLRAIYLSGREEAAIAQLKSYLVKHPNAFWAWANLGSMHKERKEYPQSIEAYKKSLAINPGVPSHHYFLGITYLESGDVDLAIGELKTGIALDSNSFTYHNELGMVYKNM